MATIFMTGKKFAGISAVILAILGGAIAGGLKYYRSQSPRQIEENMDGIKVAVEELSFFDGKDKIYGKIFKPADSLGVHPVLIFCHGIGATADFGSSYCRAAVSHGFVAYSFDFPNGSENSRSGNEMTKMSVDTEAKALETVIKRISKEKFVNPDKIFILGHSLGGLVATMVAAEKKSNVAGLILLAPAFCVPDNNKDRYPRVSDIPDTTEFMGLTLGKDYYKATRDLKPYKLMKKFDGDVLIIQGTEDKMVQMSYAENAAENFPHCQLEKIEGGDHNFAPAYRKQATALIGKYLDDHE